ncbi:MAG: Cna B-type domain-containing protein, partial [Clostridiales bacterium]|nr:Cna B-type domain-containing protein [Clostridiales bacterium]
GVYTIKNEIVTFDLNGWQTASLQYLPTGSSYTATYTVKESVTTSSSWYTLVTYDGDEDENKTAEVTVKAGEITEVTYTNIITANIEITKSWNDLSNLFNTRPSDGESFIVTLTPVIATTVDGVITYELDTDSAISTTGTWDVDSSDPDSWKITLENVPLYDSDGNAVTYAITETNLELYTLSNAISDETTVLSTVEIEGETYYIVTPAGSDGTSFTLTNELDTDSVSVTIYGTKVWVDGKANHVNSSDVELTLQYYDSASGEWVNYEGEYTVSWDESDTNNWLIQNLPKYDESDTAYVWRVVETSIAGYVTTYDSTDNDASDAEAVPSDNSSSNRYTITNTIKQEYLTLSGTKTWVDGNLTHNNSEDVTLVVTRSSTSVETETLVEETDYTVSWDGNTYTITGTGNGLPKYDDAGYVYTYTVTESTTNGQITVTIDGVEYTYDVTYDGYNITNTREEEESTSDKTEAGTADEDGTTSEGTAYAAYSEVSVGDKITYTISYYNGNNTSADITIEDILDNGVTWVSATNPKTWTDTASDSYSISGQSEGTDSGGETYYGGIVTWSFTADAFERGTVTLTVKVNENAKTAGDALSDDWNDTATVDNQATVTIADNEMVPDIVITPLEDDDPTAPTKSVEIYDDEDGDADYDDDDKSVSVGDTITYRISYYNNLAATATVTITDVLDDGVTYGSSTDGGTYDSDTHTVSWELTVAPFTGGYVYVTVTVNDNAKLSENTYDVNGAGSLDYGVDEENTTASIADE